MIRKFSPDTNIRAHAFPLASRKLPILPHNLQKMVQREHGEKAPATLAEEKKFNPYLQAATLAGFMDME